MFKNRVSIQANTLPPCAENHKTCIATRRTITIFWVMFRKRLVTLVPANVGTKPSRVQRQKIAFCRGESGGDRVTYRHTVQSAHDATECVHVGAMEELR